jgi:hypothetical protein
MRPWRNDRSFSPQEEGTESPTFLSLGTCGYPPSSSSDVCHQRRAQRVRCNRASGVRAPLVPQDDVRGLLRCYEFDAFVSQSPQVDPFEQPFSSAEQDG